MGNQQSGSGGGGKDKGEQKEKKKYEPPVPTRVGEISKFIISKHLKIILSRQEAQEGEGT